MQNIMATTKAVDVILEMPKFKIESKFSLVDALQSIGCTDIFNEIDCKQSLGKMMQVSDVI